MSNIVIDVNQVSKLYKLYDTPQDRLKEALHPFRKTYHKDFYALKNVNFQIRQGESIGIVGANGAGKSTLLKVISGVATPSEGNVVVNGKIAALLELGAGFNPELNGIENIFFYGALIGLSKDFIEDHIESILAFADIGDFIQQPLKSYSSGMLMRLAFAVAVNLDPDILIIDEALGVGDMRFQLKCARRMEELVEQKKTLLFVSHSNDMVNNFCQRAIWLRDGQIVEDGPAKEVTRNYSNFMLYGFLSDKKLVDSYSTSDLPIDETQKAIPVDQVIVWRQLNGLSSVGEGGAKIVQAALHQLDGMKQKTMDAVDILSGGENVILYADVFIEDTLQDVMFTASITNELGNVVTGLHSRFLEEEFPTLQPGQVIRVAYKFQVPMLKNGPYSITLGISTGSLTHHIRHHCVHDAIMFRVNGNLRSQQNYYVSLPNAEISIEDLSVASNSK